MLRLLAKKKTKEETKQTIGLDSTVNGMVCVEKTVPLALTPHIQLEHYYLYWPLS